MKAIREVATGKLLAWWDESDAEHFVEPVVPDGAEVITLQMTTEEFQQTLAEQTGTNPDEGFGEVIVQEQVQQAATEAASIAAAATPYTFSATPPGPPPLPGEVQALNVVKSLLDASGKDVVDKDVLDAAIQHIQEQGQQGGQQVA